MARKPKDNGSRKFGAPLYCAAWPAGYYPIVGGGGGKRSSGIPNRAVVLKVENGSLSDKEQGDLRTNELTPFNMALHPNGQTVVVGVGSAGLQVIDVMQQPGSAPTLTLASETNAQQEVLSSFGEAKGLAFSNDGKLLAVGVHDAVHIHEWPSLVSKATIRRRKDGLSDAVRDVDFSRAHANSAVIAVTCEDGSCSLWSWSGSTHVGDLELPSELAGGAFKSCRFSRDGQKGLFTVVNHQGSGHILYWHQTDVGEMEVLRQTRTNSFAAPITAFDISPSGTFLGTGTSEGDVATFLAEDLRPLQRVKGAHMVFTTALTFSRDEQTMLTVSADASALATKASRKPTSSPSQLYLLFAVLVCILTVLCMFVWSRSGPRGASGAVQDRAHVHASSNQEL